MMFYIHDIIFLIKYIYVCNVYNSNNIPSIVPQVGNREVRMYVYSYSYFCGVERLFLIHSRLEREGNRGRVARKYDNENIKIERKQMKQ